MPDSRDSGVIRDVCGISSVADRSYGSRVALRLPGMTEWVWGKER